MTPFSGDIYVIASFFGGVGERLLRIGIYWSFYVFILLIVNVFLFTCTCPAVILMCRDTPAKPKNKPKCYAKKRIDLPLTKACL
jgi:hypothetical protein